MIIEILTELQTSNYMITDSNLKFFLEIKKKKI